MAVATKNRIAETNGEHKEKKEGKHVEISAPNFQTGMFRIAGTSPLVIQRFSEKAKQQMHGVQEAGAQSKKGKKREPKDFKQCYEDAKYKSVDGWCGIPTSALRAAMVAACKIVGFQMTRAKLGIVRIVPDGITNDGISLVKISKGQPKYFEQPCRNDNGSMDLRARPMWEEGWECEVRVEFDLDMFSPTDIANLLSRAGMQVGICEGRNNSRKCVGLGWGAFKVLGK